MKSDYYYNELEKMMVNGFKVNTSAHVIRDCQRIREIKP
jgi:hypothetical protein